LNFIKKYYILFILLITACFVQIITNNKKIQLKNVEEKKFNNQTDKIKSCIDIDNKSRRTNYENIKLSEYCIDKFGTIK